ncbi:MAG: PQQ-binding-like beta-propeller repeat protein, partial [Actinomycetota bacterium]
ALETAPAAIERMRVVAAHLDQMSGRELVVQTDRQITAVDPAGEILWSREPLEARNVLVAAREPVGERLWIQGPVTPGAGLPAASVGGVALAPTEHLLGRYRLFGLDPLTGRGDRTIPLMGVITGLTRLDVNADGVPDRIMGGASETVFALDGSSQRLLWSRFLGDPAVDAVMRGEHPGNPVVDILTEDVNDDGRPELIVESLLAVFALDSTDGRIVWSYELAPTLGSGRWSGFELADLTGDGVRDVALGTSSARSGGYNAIENAHLLAIDGTSGTVLWHHPFPPPVKRVNGLDVGDADGDGTPDIGVALESMGTPWLYAVAVIDGGTGVPLWQRAERDLPGGSPAPINAARMIDAGADGDADLAVITWFDGTDGVVVRTHDGRTGDQVWIHPVGSPGAPGAEFGYGLYRGRLDPQGPEILLASATAEVDLSKVGIVEGNSSDGQRVFSQTLPQHPWDVEMGDVTGDGAGDIVVPWVDGFGVIDGASALAGDPSLLGHLVDRRPTKVKLFDVDGDGVLEIETFRTPQGWPLYVGHHLLRDDFGPGKAVSTVDLGTPGP